MVTKVMQRGKRYTYIDIIYHISISYTYRISISKLRLFTTLWTLQMDDKILDIQHSSVNLQSLKTEMLSYWPTFQHWLHWKLSNVNMITSNTANEENLVKMRLIFQWMKNWSYKYNINRVWYRDNCFCGGVEKSMLFRPCDLCDLTYQVLNKVVNIVHMSISNVFSSTKLCFLWFDW